MREGPSKLGVVASILARLLLFAALGGVATVAVAWGVALRKVPFSAISAMSNDESREAIIVPYASKRDASVFVFEQPVNGWGWTYLDVRRWDPWGTISDIDLSGVKTADRFPPDRPIPFDGPNTRTDIQFGWPARSCYAFHLADWSDDTGNDYGWSHALALDGSRMDVVAFFRFDGLTNKATSLAVPIGILPRGFAINTGFYAASWWIAIVSAKLTRGQIRAWRGRCRGCAYSLAGLEAGTPCPECGMGVRHNPR